MGPRPLGGLCFPLVPEEGVRDRMGLSAPAAGAGTSEGLHEGLHEGAGDPGNWNQLLLNQLLLLLLLLGEEACCSDIKMNSEETRTGSCPLLHLASRSASSVPAAGDKQGSGRPSRNEAVASHRRVERMG